MENIIFDPFKVLMEVADNPIKQDIQPEKTEKVYLIYPDEKRDITDIYNGHIDKCDGVTVLYTHSIVNGVKMPDRHSTHHINGRIKFEYV